MKGRVKSGSDQRATPTEQWAGGDRWAAGSVAPRRLSSGSRRLSLHTAGTHREPRGKGQALN